MTTECPQCQHENREGARFCDGCGIPLAPAACSACGIERRSGARFCDSCGAPVGQGAQGAGGGVGIAPIGRTGGAARPAGTLARAMPSPAAYTPPHLAEKILHSRSVLEGERKQVTVLFADIKGSMELAEQLDPEDWHTVLDRFFQVVGDGIHSYEGTINQYTGDGIMALFGAPIAHEDHPHRACHAALALRDDVAAYAREVRARHGVSLELRIGLNSGEVIVGSIGDDLRMDYTAQGHVVGLAQRMEQMAGSGGICVSEATARLVEGYFQLADLGQASIKGATDPVRVFELQGTGLFRTRLDASRARGLSSFVGRAGELDRLSDALRSSMDARARIVGVVAHAGVGKSRLCFEFAERCRSQGLAVYEGHCPAHGAHIPYLPIIDMLRSYFGVGLSDDARATREKIAGRLLLLDPAFESTLPLVWHLLGVAEVGSTPPEPDADATKRKLFDFIRHLVTARSTEAPAILLFDDLHWIDPLSDELVAELAEAIQGTRTLLLVNFRPEYRADWMAGSSYEQIALAPLGRDAIRELVGEAVGQHESAIGLPEAVADRTAGNPFFTEEVIQSLVESGHLAGVYGNYELTRPIDQLAIPETVQAILAARIDRLPEREKSVLHTAAVIGKEFAASLLARVAELPDAELESSLRALGRAEFVYESSGQAGRLYAFKHPLTQEVAYNTQLGAKRRNVHARLAERLEERGASAASLAYHWDAAEDVDRALHWHRTAGRELGFLDWKEALHQWTRVAELADSLPESAAAFAEAGEARAHILWLELRTGTTPQRADRLFQEACDLAERSGSLGTLARAKLSYGLYLLYNGRPGGGPIVLEAVEAADRSGEPNARVASRWASSVHSVFMVAPATGLAIVEETLELTGGDPEVGFEMIGYSPYYFLLGTRAYHYAQLGRFDEAATALQLATASHDKRHGNALGMVSTFGVYVHQLFGNVAEAVACAEHGVEVAETYQNPAALIFCYSQLGAARILDGQCGSARAALQRALGLSIDRAIFAHQRPELYASLALAELGDDKLDAAAEALEAARVAAEATEVHHGWLPAQLARARLCLARDPSAAHAGAEAIDAARQFALDAGAPGHLPYIGWEWAQMLEASGDTQGARREFERALEISRSMGATGYVERITKKLHGVQQLDSISLKPSTS